MKLTYKFVLFVCALSAFVSVAQAGRSYRSVLGDWTRSDHIYTWDNFEARLIWHATYESPSFREAKVEKYTHLYELQGEELLRYVSQEEEEGRKFDVFILSVYAGSNQWYDFGRDTSLWRLVLETNDGKRRVADSLHEITQTQVERALFPHADKWSKLYEVKFPKIVGPETKTVTLKMVGVPADSTLTWSLN